MEDFMSDIVLTAYNGAILGPIAKALGWIMNGIYIGLYKLFGIESVTLSIIIITIIIYMCLLPLTIKQQKFSKLSMKMQPEIQAIQNKYKGKRDQASMQAMNEETSLVYQKYGISPTGSCLPLLLQMPILFALYRVFYNIPAYIPSIKAEFTDLVSKVIATDGYTDKIVQLMTDNNFTTSSGLTAKNVADTLSNASNSELNNYIIDVLYKLPSTAWDGLSSIFPNAADQIESTVSHIEKFNYFIGLNISDTPWSIIKTNIASHSYLLVVLALAIPVISYLTQVLNIKLMPQSGNNNQNAQADQMAQQMKTMNTMMPLVSLFMCFTVPVGLGIYWIMSALVRVVQQFFINKHIENLDLDDIIAKNQEKAKKKREKMGISENQIRDAAKMKTRTIDNKSNMKSFADKELELEKANSIKSNAKSGSMAAKANKVKEFNERNSR